MIVTLVTTPLLTAVFRDQENMSSETKFPQNVTPLEYFVQKLLLDAESGYDITIISFTTKKKKRKEKSEFKNLHIFSKYKSIKTNHLSLNDSRLVAIAELLEKTCVILRKKR